MKTLRVGFALLIVAVIAAASGVALAMHIGALVWN